MSGWPKRLLVLGAIIVLDVKYTHFLSSLSDQIEQFSERFNDAAERQTQAVPRIPETAGEAPDGYVQVEVVSPHQRQTISHTRQPAPSSLGSRWSGGPMTQVSRSSSRLIALLTGHRGFLPWLALFPAAFLGYRYSRKLKIGARQSVSSAPPQKMAAKESEIRPPAELIGGKYELKRYLGHGAMGEVFEGWDVSLQRFVAIKQMSDSLEKLGPWGRKPFVDEARAVADVHHPNIVDIYEIVDDGSAVYLVFELLKGKTLDTVIRENRRLAPADACRILKPVCEALSYAHGRDLIHRDLKPGNIMLLEDGRIKLMDFGISQRLPEDTSDHTVEHGPTGVRYAKASTPIGTPAYMSPEAESGFVCKEADIYSLGVCLYEMLTGDLPYGRSPSLTDKAYLNYEEPSKKAATPKPFDLIIRRALEPNPESRMKTVQEFQHLLGQALQGAS